MIGAHQTFVMLDAQAKNVPLRQRSGLISELFGGTALVVSRRLCSFRSKVMEEGTLTSRMLSALILETEAHSSFEKTGMYVTFQDDVANIWTWDEAELEKLTDVPVRHAVPETLFHESSDGFRLRACIEGYEGQFWQNNTLMSSRWWSDVPQERDWVNFVRAGGGNLPSEYATDPDTIEQGFSYKVRPLRNRMPVIELLKKLPKTTFVLIGAALFSVAITFYGMRNLTVELERRQYDSERVELDQATREKRVLRRQLLGLQKELETYGEVFKAAEPLTAISAVAEAVSEIGAEIDQIDYADAQIDVRFRAAEKFQQRDLVQKLEASENLQQVSVSRLGLSGVWEVTAKSVKKGEANE